MCPQPYCQEAQRQGKGESGNYGFWGNSSNEEVSGHWMWSAGPWAEANAASLCRWLEILRRKRGISQYFVQAGHESA